MNYLSLFKLRDMLINAKQDPNIIYFDDYEETHERIDFMVEEISVRIDEIREERRVKQSEANNYFGGTKRPRILRSGFVPTFIRQFHSLPNYISPAPTSIINKEFHKKSGLKNLIVEYFDIKK